MAGLRRGRSIWPKHINVRRTTTDFTGTSSYKNTQYRKKEPINVGVLSERRYFHHCDATSVDLTGDDEAKFL